VWGALGYRDGSAAEWAGYFNGNLHATGVITSTASLAVTKALNTQSSELALNNTAGGANDYLKIIKYGSSASGSVDGLALAGMSVLWAGANAGPMMFQVTTANPLYMLTNNVQRLRIEADGDVAVGETAAVDSRLHVADKVDIGGSHLGANGLRAAVKGISAPTTSRTFKAGVAGYLGGTTLPTSAAGVLGAPSSADSPAVWGALGYRDTVPNDWAGYFTGNSYFSGNVGLGTVNPQGKLHIKAAGNADGAIIDLQNDVNGNNTGLYFKVASTDDNSRRKAAILFERTATYGLGSLHFAVNNAADNTNVTKTDARMTITSDGRVGISTDTPKATLHVNGEIGLGDGTDIGNKPVVVWLRNSSGGTVDPGSIVIAGGSNSFTTTAGSASTYALGVVYGASVANNAVGRVAISGIAPAKCGINTTAGHQVVTYSTSGTAQGQTMPNAGASIGVWLENCTAPGTANILLK
jgi:hypothetical protein